MNFKLSSVILALAAVAASSPTKRTPASCQLVLTPSATPPPGTDFNAEFNYVIGRSVSIVNPYQGVTYLVNVWTPLGNGSYHVATDVEGTGLTAPQTEVIVLGFLGQNLQGFAVSSWFTDNVSC